jgi:2-keto-3-deoxy-L-rhamnonate aldolase RhmA
MNPNFRDGLRNGDVLIGTLITMPLPEIAEIMVEVGFDWLFVDKAETAEAFIQQGFTLIAISTDGLYMALGAKETLNSLKR